MLDTMSCHHSYHLHLFLSLVDRWGATNDLATSYLHPFRLPRGGAQRHASPFRHVVLPSLFSVCLSFSLLVMCPAGLSWQVLKILLRGRTQNVSHERLQDLMQICINKPDPTWCLTNTYQAMWLLMASG